MAEQKNSVSPISVLFRTTRRRFRDPLFCVASSIVIATMVAFLLTSIRGVPAPIEHDEFSYLLGADTFASMRGTNPTHPMWQCFETFHVIQQPSYTSKYPPAQAFTLAAGQLLGHPIIGSSLATGLSIGALVWMLTGWLPRKFYWLAWLFVVFHPSLQIIWGQSYWGGAVALTGASLLLGAFVRLTKKFELRYSVIAAIGVVLLANSRPFEGAVLAVSVFVALIWKLSSNSEWRLKPFLARTVLPATLVLACGFSCMLSYNQIVTGSIGVFPYQVHESTYASSPVFLWQQPVPSPGYRHADLRRFHEQDRIKIESTFRTSGDVFLIKAKVGIGLVRFFWGGAAIVALVGIPFLFRQPKYRLAMALVTPAFAAALVTPWAHYHYCAPASPLLLLFFVGGIIAIWKQVRQQPALRFAMTVVVPVLYLISWTTIYVVTLNQQHLSWANQRVEFVEQLRGLTGRDLVIVRYSIDHDPHQEWVYNAADIDNAEIVWAREMPPSQQAELIEYFADRTVWVLEPDSPDPELKRLAPQ